MASSRHSAIVIGAGVGGLAASIELARAGVHVRVLERAASVGGKLREVVVDGHTMPAGPSVFTMREVFEALFGGPEAFAAELELVPLDPLCRHFFSDGSVLDLYLDAERSRAAIEKFAGAKDARGYHAFRQHAKKIHEIVRGPFMERALEVGALMRPSTILQLTHIDAMRSLWKAVESHFDDPRLRQLFGRYATYNGSSPFHAPATLAVIVHVENAHGIFSCKGGIYRLAEALERRARSLGVEIETGVEVEEIVVERDRAVGVRRVGAGVERADVVISAADAAHTYDRLLAGSRKARGLGRKYADEELSLSAYNWLCVVDRSPLDLSHHNVFFSTDYRREFEELVDRRRAPSDPTVYLCADDRLADTTTAVERAFLLTNAPPLDARGAQIDWREEAVRCRARIERTLARHGWKLVVHAQTEQTPADFAQRFPGSKGALYGLASNSRLAAFKRPANQVPGIAGLFLVGGTVHPGAGMPMVCLSARIASSLALAQLR